MYESNPWKKVPERPEKNWVDDYAPAEKTEAEYFYNAVLPEESTSARPSSPSLIAKIRSLGWKPLAVLVVTLLMGSLILGIGEKPSSSADATNKKTSSLPKEGTKTQHITYKRFSSTAMGVTASYPASWEYTESPRAVAFTSRPVSVPTAEGAKEIRVRLSIVAGGSPVASQTSSRGQVLVAVADSSRLMYESPSSQQRSTTYVTPTQIPTGSFAQVRTVYLTGSRAFASLEDVPMTTIYQADPFVSIGFLLCEETNCAPNGSITEIPVDYWVRSDVKAQTDKILSSLVIGA